jgi:hypothetical protein
MPNPQQPELRRSAKTAFQDPDAVGGQLEAQRVPDADGDAGPVPPGNRPGPKRGRANKAPQDKPDLDAFAAKLGIDEPDPDGERAAEAAQEQVQAEHEERARAAEERAAFERARDEREREEKAQERARRDEEERAARDRAREAGRDSRRVPLEEVRLDPPVAARGGLVGTLAGAPLHVAKGLLGTGVRLGVGAAGMAAGAATRGLPALLRLVRRGH